VREWADEHELSVRDGHVQFPDCGSNWRRRTAGEIEDIEVTTLHYRGLHASGKASAGFTRYRSSGGRSGGGRVAAAGGGVADPIHLAEEVLR
jgi:hypothetical protein